jgi:PKD repeat protein/pimeloyl-ACP methyl ester carboxylesterase
MKRTILSFFILFLFMSPILALADLTLTQGSIDNTRLNRGEYLTVRATAINSGDKVATATYALISLQALGSTSRFPLGRVGLKALSMRESQLITYIFPMPRTLAIGSYNVVIELDSDQELPENNEGNNFFCMGGGTCTELVITNQYTPDRNIPCPMILVHGWVGDDTTWDEFTQTIDDNYGATKGGTFHFCLNPDGNAYTSDGCDGLLDFTDYSSIKRSADYYTVNFNIGRNGRKYNGDDLSNQSAIVKQGCALSKIIKQVLALTNAQEVILVGHSMGGLASREYIQNKGNWQADGKHHIAKLVTVGTPNGGSNTSGANLGTFVGYNELSEAVRDLRHPSTRFNGIYLFGGNERDVVASYNKDINCNGSETDNIVGLNSKTFPPDIAAACVIGTEVGISFCTGASDLVVCDDRADLNNYPFSGTALHADRFIIKSDGSFIPTNNIAYHGNLHQKNSAVLMQALDEPKNYAKAYDINVGEGFFGTVTFQAANDPFPEPDKSIDYDDYRFNIAQRSAVRVFLANIPTRTFSAFIVDSTYRVLHQLSSNAGSNIDQNIVLEKGTYFLEIFAKPDAKSWFYPYFFGILATPLGGVPNAIFTTNNRTGCSPMSVAFTNQSTGSPTSFSWKFEGGTPSTSSAQNPTVSYTTAGNYNVSLTVSNSTGSTSSVQQGFISVGKIPQANFVNSSDSLAIRFFNLTNAGTEARYSWSFGDGTSSTSADVTHTYVRAGTYIVKLTASNSCGSNTIEKTITVKQTTPTSDFGNEKDFSLVIFPNPSTGKVVLQVTGVSDENLNLDVFNIVGVKVFDSSITNNKDVELNLSNLPNGSYILVLKSKSKEVRKKMIIQK